MGRRRAPRSVTPHARQAPRSAAQPKVAGKGGTYVSDAGQILTEVEFAVEGALVLTTPMGLEVNFEGNGKCERGITVDYFKGTKVNHCLNCAPPGQPPGPGTPPPPTTPPTTPTTPPTTPTEPPKTDAPMALSATSTTGDYCTIEPDPYPFPTTTVDQPVPTTVTDVVH